jgi:hypothetical protein
MRNPIDFSSLAIETAGRPRTPSDLLAGVALLFASFEPGAP